jgi:hypothetical protein
VPGQEQETGEKERAKLLLCRAGEAVEGARAMAGAERRMSSGHEGSWFVMT